MTQDEIIEMADKAGFFVKDKEAYSPSVQEDHELTPYLVAFANLVAAKEREACAKICDEFCYGSTKVLVEKAIRARGYKQDGQCKRCTDGCPACDATKLPKEAHDLF